jgi:hypothetical protein
MKEMDDPHSTGFHGHPNADEGPLLDDELREIACLIEGMPQLEPPESLLSGVIAAIRGKKLPWRRRFMIWLRSPRSITFTPLHVGALAAILVFFAAFIVLRMDPKSPNRLASAGRRPTPVVFSLNLPEARSVALVGSFNQWRSQGFEMQREGSNKNVWTITLTLPEGRYEYAFMVDGEKLVADPQAGFYQNDGFGNENAVLILGNRDEKAI